MSSLLPIVQDSARFSVATELNDATWVFEFRWNARGAQWVMSVSDGDGNPVASGIPVVLGLPLLRGRVKGLGGEIMALDTSGQGVDAAFEDLGRRVVLVHFNAADVGLV